MASLTGSIVVRKTSDETVNNSTTLQNDDHLVIAVGANEVWYFEALLLYNSGTTPDIKFAFTVPSGASLSWSLVNKGDTSGGDAALQLSQTSGAALIVLGTAGIHVCLVKGIVRMSSTAGNLQLQWAQQVANASDTKVLTDSWLVGARES